MLQRAETPPMESTKGTTRIRAQVPLTTGESDPSQGLLRVQGSQRSCSRDHRPHESDPSRGQLRVQSSQSHHHRHGSSPPRGLLMSTHYSNCEGGPIKGLLKARPVCVPGPLR